MKPAVLGTPRCCPAALMRFATVPNPFNTLITSLRAGEFALSCKPRRADPICWSAYCQLGAQ